MQVQVTGKHVDVGEALRSRVSDEITSSIGKYFDRGGGADVVVSREGHSFKVDCAVTLASGQQLTTHGLGLSLTRLMVFCLSAFFAGISGALVITQTGTASGTSVLATVQYWS